MQKLIILTSFSLLLGACSLFPEVYSVPRYQGNIVEQKMIDKLKPGLTRDQVTYIMGTPLIQDPFHQGRWDYVYTTQTVNSDRTEEHIALFFTGDTLTGLRGDFKPEPQPEGVVLDDLEATDEGNEIKERRNPSAQPVGEDTTLYTGGTINAIPPEGTVTETQTVTPPPSSDPYQGLTADGRLATSPTPSPTAVPAN